MISAERWFFIFKGTSDVIGRLTGLPSIVYANPIVDQNDASAGAAFASLRAEAFGVLGKDGDMPMGAVYLVVAHDGRVLQRFPELAEARGKGISEIELFRFASHQSSGSLETSGLYPQDGEDEKTLMKIADGAMYRVKQRGKNDFQFHSHG